MSCMRTMAPSLAWAVTSATSRGVFWSRQSSGSMDQMIMGHSAHAFTDGSVMP